VIYIEDISYYFTYILCDFWYFHGGHVSILLVCDAV